LHDALVTLGFVTVEEGQRGLPRSEIDRPRTGADDATAGWSRFFEQLKAEKRVALFRLHRSEGELWVAAERIPQLLAVHPGASLEPSIVAPPRHAAVQWEDATALVELIRGRLEGLGPVTAGELARDAGLEQRAVEAALTTLEAEGFAMQGRFTADAHETEWCERGLLARIHRYTLDRLRREIAPVSKTDFMRFLLGWQHVEPQHRVEGPESVAPLLDQLEGFAAPAAVWEGEILPARLTEYDPVWLDALCLSGRVVWGRAGTVENGTSHARPIRTTPIALASREHLAAWSALGDRPKDGDAGLAPEPRRVFDSLRSSGASFFDEIVRRTGLLRTQTEDALGDLVARGLVTADSFAGLRALLTPSSQRPPLGRRRKRSTAVFGMESAGRWSLLRSGGDTNNSPSGWEWVALALLRRYGVVFRGLLLRESLLPPWRELLRVYRRLEARGEIRGGRFVDGFSGEQFALPEAVGRLRAVRRQPASGSLVSLSAADPLNLVGILLPGNRVPALAANRVLYRDGEAIAILESNEPRFLVELDQAERWEMQNALLRRRVPPQLRAYLGRSA
jgi:ATP-dependent Lhr-like helicase